MINFFDSTSYTYLNKDQNSELDVKAKEKVSQVYATLYAKNLKRKTRIGHSQILRTATDKVKMLPVALL